MNETKVFSFPDGGGNSMAPYLAMMQNNQFNNPWAYLILLALFNGGFGGFGGGANNALDMETQNKLNSLSTQLNDSQNSSYINQAIQGNTFALSQLSQNLGVNYNALQSAINSVTTAINTVGAQNGMGFLQLTSALQAGDAAISRQLCECCCDNRLLTTQQGYESQIRTLESNNMLSSQADRNTRSITDAIAAQTTMITKEFCELKERELQDKINSLTADNAILRTTMNNNAQTAQFAAMLAPINAELAAIKAGQPPTITLPLNQYTAVPTLLANGATDFIASYWANRLTNATTPTDTTTTTP